MIKASRIVTTALLLAALPAAAQHQGIKTKSAVTVPANSLLSAEVTAHLNKQLNAFLSKSQVATTGSKTAAGPERLIAQANYDFTTSTSGLIQDSLKLQYNNSTRTSSYDYFGLYYDMYNESDKPAALSGGTSTGFVHYDTARLAQPGSSTNMVVSGIRTYNVAGKVTIDDHPEDFARTYFQYDANGRLVKTTTLDGSGGTGLDSVQRDFYFYNSSGFLVADSSESWDGSAWAPSFTALLTNNAAGYPTQVNVRVMALGLPLTFLQVNTTFNSANLPVTSVFKLLGNPFAPLQNMSKDSFAYNGNMLVFNNSYSWDTLALAWNLSMAERRHLNASSLPDSAWRKYYTNGVATDSAVIKISYNSYGNPTSQRNYMGDGTTKQFESRYYYAATAGLGGSPVKKDISVYPNPVANELRVNGIGNGRFVVINAAGQIIVKGSLSTNTTISVGGVPAGGYKLIADDLSGVRHVATFVKQ
jgi:YD repeat-containing protein